jgi:hypothetical protein
MQTRRTIISSILSAIPSFDQEEVKISELIPHELPPKKRLEILHQINGLLHTLAIFNVISITKSGKVKANTEVGTYFLRSFSRYIQKNLHLVSSWERPGLDQEFDIHTMMNWGSNFLYLMEHRRVKQFGDTEPIRFVDVVQVVIKARVAGNKEPLYLMQYDTKAHVFQLIGGIRKDTISDSDTIQSKLVKELPLNNFVYGKTYKAKKISLQMAHETISPTYGAYSRYTFDIFHLSITLPFLKLGPLDKWVSYQEIRAGVTKDGITISDIDYRKIDFKKLRVSLTNEQPPHHVVFNAGEITHKDTGNTKIKKLIQKGETESVEFKSSLRYDYNTHSVNKGLEKPILKTIAAFLNSGGGILVIGINDEGEALGLSEDFKTLQRKNNDGFSQTLFNSMTSNLGIEFSSFIQVEFSEIDKKTLCIVTVKASPEPVFVRDAQNRDFYVRAGTTTKLLNSEETFKYIALHW